MTQQDPPQDQDAAERIATLVPGLDQILCGGFLRGGLYMVQGTPGMGKTILASQIAYRWAAGGAARSS
jgi:circadian clock protein KaiC